MVLDLTKTYKVEPKISLGDAQGLDKFDLSRHVGTLKQISVHYDTLTGKFKTGLDENAPEVLALPKEEREQKIDWIKATRSSLEQKIGRPGILDPTNEDFWSVWSVNLEIGQDKHVKVFGQHPYFIPETHWSHALALITLQANDALPMSKKEANNPKYKDAQFYITTPEEEVTMSKEKVRENRARNTEMSKLFDDTNPLYERALRIAYLLNVQKEPVGLEKLEEVLEMFSSQKEYIKRFLELCKMEDQELELRTTLKKAIELDVISFNAADKVYYRGGFNMRGTEEAVVNMFKVNLADPVIAREYVEIKDAVNKRESKKKKKTIA